MIRSISASTTILAAFLCAHAQPASSQTNPWVAACEARKNPRPADYSWAQDGSIKADAPEIDASQILMVKKNRTHAVALLSHRSFVRLTKSQFRAFTGQSDAEYVRSKVRPYLVRAITADPTDPGAISVQFDGRTLQLTGSAMGACPEVAKSPIIVFLGRSPKRVYVGTSGYF